MSTPRKYSFFTAAVCLLTAGLAQAPRPEFVFHNRSVTWAGSFGVWSLPREGSGRAPQALPNGLEEDPALLIRQPDILDAPIFSSACGSRPAGPYSFVPLLHSQSRRAVRADPVPGWLDAMTRQLTDEERRDLRAQWLACGGTLDAFPLRALAVVNRIDLFKPDQASCGELRIVYGAFGRGTDGRETLLRFFVIAEFQIGCSNRADLQDWARCWLALRDRGARPTRLMRLIHKSLPRKQLWRVRTNQFVANRNWEFGEFRGPTLEPVALAQTPGRAALNAPELEKQVLALAASPDPDRAFDQAVYRPPALRFEYSSRDIWLPRLYGDRSDARYSFAIRTCVGCHSWETRNPLEEEFTHIHNRFTGQPGKVSRFLSGGRYRLPPMLASQSVHEPERTFADLLRRRQVLEAVANAHSFAALTAIPRIWDVH